MAKQPVKPTDTFFTSPIKWNDGLRRGFVVYPHTVEGTSWGEPYRTEAGDLIIPGTEGGENSHAVLGAKNNSWKVSRNKKIQSAGNIDWMGDWKDEDETKRYVVTCHGPTRRYWNTGGFSYDGNEQNQNIYMGGRVVAIAPYPVLGACVIKDTDPKTGNNVDYVVAMCKEGGSDALYIKKGLDLTKASAITEDTRSRLTRLDTAVDKTLDPPEEGWYRSGSTDGYTDSAATVAPEAPWFFNTSGTEARTMRKARYQHQNGLDPDLLADELVHRELRCTIDPKNLSCQFSLPTDIGVLESEGRFTMHHEVYKTHVPEYVHPPQPYDPVRGGDNYSHKFKEDGLQMTIRLYGTAKVAVDFKPDSGWIYGYIQGKMLHSIEQYWTEGIDEPNSPAEDAVQPPELRRKPNTGSEVGPLPNEALWDSSKPRQPNDHWPSKWIGLFDITNFYIGGSAEIAIGWGLTGDKTMEAGGVPPDENGGGYGVLKFIDSYDVYIKFVDLRWNMFVGYVYYDALRVGDNGTTVTNSEHMLWACSAANQTGGSGYFDTTDGPLLTSGGVNHFFYRDRTGVPITNSTFTGYGWTREEMEDWTPEGEPKEYEYDEDSGSSYAFSFNDTNYNEALYKPYWVDAYPSWMGNALTRPYFIRAGVEELLYTPGWCDVDGLLGATEHNEQLFYLEYYNPSSQNIEAEAFSPEVSGDPVKALNGGDRMLPGGLL